MAATTFTAENASEALILEQALAFARQLTRLANDAPDGHVLALAERCVLSQGRDFLRQALATVLQAQAEEVEKKAPFRSCCCGQRRDNKGKATQQTLTAIGVVQLRRSYFVCCRCGDAGCPLDDRLGVHGYVSPEALRLICAAGGSWSFDLASRKLHEFCGLQVRDELIRQATLGEGPKMAAFAETTPEAVQAFAAAAGDAEFETDATKVNSSEGWRDAKIGIFAKRPRGEAVPTQQWKSRVLPKATARFAFAAIEESQVFACRWGVTAERLGIDPYSEELSVLGDGAEWIWNRAAEQFPHAQGCLDVFHGIEHVSDTAKAYLGEGSVAQAAGVRGQAFLLADGYAGLLDWVGELGQQSGGGDGAALGSLLNYFAGHQERLCYALRLRRGQALGSGMVEGAAKNMIGKRLKANNARWLEKNVNRIAAICTAQYSETWEAYWQSR